MPLSSDVVFKRMFSKEENKDLLKSLLEAILKTNIRIIEIKNPEISRDLKDSKAGTLDVKAEINGNMIIDIEMQVEDEKNMSERSTRYLMGMSNDELKKGEDYKEIRKVVTINLLKYNYLKRNSYFSVAHLKFEDTLPEAYVDMEYDEEVDLATDRLEMIFIELPKFKKKNPDLSSELNQWLWLILGEEAKIEMASKENKKIRKAVQIIDEMSMDPKEWELYRSRQMAIMNYNAGIYFARKEGREEGIKEERIENAKKMLSYGIEPKQVSKITGLTIKELEQLREKVGKN